MSLDLCQCCQLLTPIAVACAIKGYGRGTYRRRCLLTRDIADNCYTIPHHPTSLSSTDTHIPSPTPQALAYSLGDAASNTPGGEEKLGTSRHNGTFAMIGTLFLFCFWPSFNAGLLVGAAQHRAVINTVLSICASTVTAFAVSKSVHNGKRFDMEHIQNATLAGGVAIGASCDMLFNSFGAILTGSVAGIVSSYGFSFLAPILKRNGLTDICGIAHLHLMPGIIGGVASAIAAAGITTSNGEYSTAAIDAQFPGRSVEGRSAIEVGGYQMAMTVISLTFGALLGWITGKIIQWPFAEPMLKS